MKIFRAIGLGLLIIILQLLMHPVFVAFENATISSFKLVQTTMDVSQEAVAHHGLALPQLHP